MKQLFSYIFADPSQPEAGQRDSQLACGEIGVEMVEDAAGNSCRKRTVARVLLNLTEADFDQGEFGGDKEPVRQHQKEDEDDFESGHYVARETQPPGASNSRSYGKCPQPVRQFGLAPSCPASGND